MTDETLRAKLASLAGDADQWDGMARVIVADGGPETVIIRILDEIDDTVLSARLTFRRGPAEIALIAGGRRLQGISHASDGLPVGNLRDRSLHAEDTAEIAACGALLRAFAAAAAGPVTVTATSSTRLGTNTEAGLSVPSLAEAWDMSPLDPSIPPLSHFITRVAPSITSGMLLRKSTVIEQVGEDGHGKVLEAVFGADIGADPALRCWLTSEEGVALAVQGDDKVAILYAPAALPDIQVHWNRVAISF